MVPPVIVDRIVSDPAEIVKQVDNVPGIRNVASEAAKKLGLRLVRGTEHAGSGSDLLCEQLPELA